MSLARFHVTDCEFCALPKCAPFVMRTANGDKAACPVCMREQRQSCYRDAFGLLDEWAVLAMTPEEMLSAHRKHREPWMARMEPATA